MMKIDEAVKQLDKFTEAYQVADFLRSSNIKGHKGSSCRCPVAVYLQAVTGRRTSVGCDTALHTDGEGPVLTLSYPVRQFIALFDASLFPDLEDSA